MSALSTSSERWKDFFRAARHEKQMKSTTPVWNDELRLIFVWHKVRVAYSPRQSFDWWCVVLPRQVLCKVPRPLLGVIIYIGSTKKSLRRHQECFRVFQHVTGATIGKQR